MAKRTSSSIFWKKMRSKYKLSFFNESTLEEVWTFKLSRLGAFLFFSALVFIIFIAATYLIAGTPLKQLLPGYLKQETRTQIIDNALRIDSLAKEFEIKDRYLRNLNLILSGVVRADSVEQIKDSLFSFPTDSFLNRSDAATAFVKEYEKEEKYRLNVFRDNIPADGFIFYAPAKGQIIKEFNPKTGHYGIDIRTSRKASVSSVLDGTIIAANYTLEQGYIIAVQHDNNFISIYKYNGGLLKKVGDKVNGGEKIAITDNDNAYTKNSNTTIEFQLWYMGQPLNPTDYIVF
ncbi:MAG: M23 family metallopeptidase [Coprobacter sp.]|nr:M23 family metallopeptidase [Coprobacter sp.]